MATLLETLQEALGSGTLAGLSQQIGADRGATEKAVAASLPLLIGGLARNSAQPQGAASLAAALERDHDGSLLDTFGSLLGGGAQGGGGLGGLLGGGTEGGGGLGGLLAAAGSLLGGGSGAGKAADGAGILRHVLGDRRGSVESGVGRVSGLDIGQVGQLLALLAPLVMGALGKVKQRQGLDANGLQALLAGERSEVERRVPTKGKGSLLDLLDRDADGSVLDDLAELAGKGGEGGLLGKLFG